MAFFARKSMWDSTVSYWSPSVASFVAFLCVCTCGHAASLPFFFAKMALGRARRVATVAYGTPFVPKIRSLRASAVAYMAAF